MKIEKIVPGGQGITTLSDGKKAFFWNALPGEEVEEFILTKKKAKYVEGIATKIREKSPFRVEPKDECFLSTSPWQIFDYQFELKIKGELVRECFSQNGIEIEAPEVVTDGKEWGYRNKMEYALYWDKEKEKIELAFHQRGTHRKVPILQSSIEKPEIIEAAKKIALELNERHEEARKYQSLVLRASKSGEVSGGLYENHKAHPQFPSLSDEILGKTYTYSPNGFFQINLPVYELALQEISKNIGNSSRILDLYSGVGTIGLSVAGDRELTLVECDKSAYGELLKNCFTASDARFRSAFPSRAAFRSPVVTGSGRSSSVVTFGGPSNETPPRSQVLQSELEENDGRIKELKTCSEKIVQETTENSPNFSSEPFSGTVDENHRGLLACSEKVIVEEAEVSISPDHTIARKTTRVHPVLAKSEEALEYIEPEMTVILDPPRAGCHEALIERLLEVVPERIIYLSCNPITQARDVKMLSEKYQIRVIKAFNFFPKTPHIENLVVLEKK